MSTPESCQSFRQTHSEVSRNFAMQAEEEQISFYSGLHDLNAKAGDEWRQAYENYLQELQAARGGDDFIQRASIAYRNLQREYGRIQTEYFKELETRQRRMFETMNALSSSASAQVLDSWIACLHDMRRNLAANEPQPSEPKSYAPKPAEPKPVKDNQPHK
jgi:hypothetical protein